MKALNFRMLLIIVGGMNWALVGLADIDLVGAMFMALSVDEAAAESSAKHI